MLIRAATTLLALTFLTGVAYSNQPESTGGGAGDSWLGTIEGNEAVVRGTEQSEGSSNRGGASHRSDSGGSDSSNTGTGHSDNGNGNDNGNGARNGAGTAGNSNSNSAGTGSTNTGATTEPACPPREIRCLLQRDDYDVIMVTLSDIERFRPSPGIQRMEPDGWTIAGLPTNIYSIAHRHIVRGELLDQPAEVRFTPVRWHWNYGDGTTATRATPGNTWAALRLGEFEATPTSHVYARSGNYTIRLNIEYRAEYRVGGSGFIPIAGTITLPANPLHITASGATTVLVDRDCTVAPRGPGC